MNQRIAAADVFGLGSDASLLGRTGDCNFVIGIWEYVSVHRPASTEVRTAAEWAYTESGQPCYEFIDTELFDAKRRDDVNAIAAATEKRRSDLARTAAAAAIDIVADATLLSDSDQEFARRIWERVADIAKWAKVKAAARIARDGTAEQQRQFIETDMSAAAKQDIDDEIARQLELTEAERLRLLARAAKQSAANRIGLVVTEQLLNLPDRDFVIEVWNNTPDGSEVQAAAIRATRSTDPAAWKAFIDTGIHQAKDRDIQIALDRQAAADRVLAQDVLTRATRTGNRNLAIAARTALAGTPDDVADFLRVDQFAVRPDLPDVVQSSHSGLCLAITGSALESEKAAVQRACNTGKDRGWRMSPKAGSMEIRNSNSGLCLAVLKASTATDAPAGQSTCDGAKDQQWKLITTATGPLRLQNVNSGQCLGIAGASKADPAPIVQRPCGAATELGWNLRPRGLVNLETGDFTGDQRADLLAVDIPSNTLYLYPGTPKGGSWGARITVGTGWNGMDKLVTGEFNRDAFTDIIAVEIATSRLWLYPGTATAGRFGTRVDVGSGWAGFRNLTVAELNRDAYPDLLTIKSTGELWLYPGTAAGGRFGAPVLVGSGWNGFSELAIGELNRDGYPDLLTVKNTGELWLYPGTAAGGRFGAPVLVGSGWNGYSELTIGAFNRDAYPDLLTVQENTGQLWIYPGTAAGGRFGLPVEIGVGG